MVAGAAAAGSAWTAAEVRTAGALPGTELLAKAHRFGWYGLGGHRAPKGEVAGLDLLTTPTRRLARAVGFVFQNPEAQLVSPVVEGEVAFGLENLAMPRQEMRRRVEAALIPNAEGTDQKYSVTLSGDELKLVTTGTAGVGTNTVYRRAK